MTVVFPATGTVATTDHGQYNRVRLFKFLWFLSFGNLTQISRVAGARPNHQELDLLKTRLEHELKEVTDVFKGELDKVNGKLATSERMLSHMYRYLAKIDAELQVVQEKLEVETYGRMELQELQRKLLQERAELKARVDAESKNSTSLTQHKRNLEDERDAKLSSMKALILPCHSIRDARN